MSVDLWSYSLLLLLLAGVAIVLYAFYYAYRTAITNPSYYGVYRPVDVLVFHSRFRAFDSLTAAREYRDLMNAGLIDGIARYEIVAWRWGVGRRVE